MLRWQALAVTPSCSQGRVCAVSEGLGSVDLPRCEEGPASSWKAMLRWSTIATSLAKGNEESLWPCRSPSQ